MPVQINEVIIRAVVDANTTTGGRATPANQASNQATPNAEIAELVLQIIKEKNER